MVELEEGHPALSCAAREVLRAIVLGALVRKADVLPSAIDELAAAGCIEPNETVGVTLRGRELLTLGTEAIWAETEKWFFETLAAQHDSTETSADNCRGSDGDSRNDIDRDSGG